MGHVTHTGEDEKYMKGIEKVDKFVCKVLVISDHALVDITCTAC
jgi:hypothetical protein